jgi:hypothetical protein
MDNFEDIERWKALAPNKGVIKIISEKTGKQICLIRISDFKTQVAAKKVALGIANLNFFIFGTKNYLFYPNSKGKAIKQFKSKF